MLRRAAYEDSEHRLPECSHPPLPGGFCNDRKEIVSSQSTLIPHLTRVESAMTGRRLLRRKGHSFHT
jgi:hypothetical protein